MIGAVQSVFDFGAQPQHTFEQFVPGENAVALGLVMRVAERVGEPQLYLWGAPGTGKTHVLQAACQRMGEHGLPAAYLSLAEAPHPGVLDGLEHLGLVALDDIQAVMGQDGWEIALFDLINRLREQQVPLLLAANAPPGMLAVNLPDLASRLGWGPVQRLDDASMERQRRVTLPLAREVLG